MKFSLHARLALIAISATAFGASTDNPAGSTPPAEGSTRTRPTSAATSAILSAGLPKFVPKPNPNSQSAAATELPEADRPRNGIIRLPRYEVREEKLPVFRERELLTDKGRAAKALKRHPGLKFGPFAFLNVRRGLEMLAEEDAYERRQEMNDLLGFQQFVKAVSAESAAGK